MYVSVPSTKRRPEKQKKQAVNKFIRKKTKHWGTNYSRSDSDRWNLVSSRLVCNETNALHLANIVESNNPNKCIGVFLDTSVQLVQHLNGVCAPEHGQLPHHPVSSVIVPRWSVILTVHESMLHWLYKINHFKSSQLVRLFENIYCNIIIDLQLEFEAGNPFRSKKVLYFLEQLLSAEIRKVWESLEFLLSNWWPNLQLPLATLYMNYKVHKSS